MRYVRLALFWAKNVLKVHKLPKLIKLSRLQIKWLSMLVLYPELQIPHVLRSGDKFCCLGMLCHVYDPTRWSKGVETIVTLKRDDTVSIEASPYIDFCQVPPDFVSYKLVGGSSGVVQDLASMNDAGVTWPEIAQYYLDEYVTRT